MNIKIISDEEIALMEIKENLKKHDAYLKDTDWYYIRKIERNIDVPNEIVVLRNEAIKYIQEHELG